MRCVVHYNYGVVADMGRDGFGVMAAEGFLILP
jgi:phage gp16-like protein